MRTLLRSLALLAATAAPAIAQESGSAAAPAPVNLLSPNYGLMAWTLIIFVILAIVLAKFAFGPITRSVEAREQALDDAMNAAKRDREEAARLLAEHRAALDASRAEAQKIIADAREAGERVRSEILEHAHTEQAHLLERTRQEINSEKIKAIADLRREAVELAIAGASRVIEKNLDQPTNRQIVESFLSTVSPASVAQSR
ncbi:MAG TPA: F0F1 ATP synthase subunit B [Gemmatimonadaceae bacterium]